MPTFININGKFIPSGDAAIQVDSRAFRYGYGLFETMLVQDGAIRLEALHWDQLKAGLAALHISASPHFLIGLAEALHKTINRNGVQALGRARLQVWPSSGGFSDSDAFNAEYCIETFTLSKETQRLNENGLIIGIAEGVIKSADAFSHIKTCSALPYALAARQAKDKYWNDALLLNQHGNIADSTIANFFLVVENTIFTPPLSEGCVAGVMRRHLMEVLPSWEYSIMEQPLHLHMIEDAKAAFLTNAIRGIRWVKELNGHHFTQEIPQALHEKLLRSFGA